MRKTDARRSAPPSLPPCLVLKGTLHYSIARARSFVRFQPTDGVTELETFESITDCETATDRDRLLLFVAVAAVEEEDVLQSADGNERDLFNRDDKWMGNWGGRKGGRPI